MDLTRIKKEKNQQFLLSLCKLHPNREKWAFIVTFFINYILTSFILNSVFFPTTLSSWLILHYHFFISNFTHFFYLIFFINLVRFIFGLNKFFYFHSRKVLTEFLQKKMIIDKIFDIFLAHAPLITGTTSWWWKHCHLKLEFGC